jgi:coiled-coil domain-containing protein 130
VQGILVIRFEMPFDVWCLGCNAHIAKGVRFNAEKQAVGKYLSTRIFHFKMRCHQCSNVMEIETDPQNNDYAMKAGVRRKVETWEPTPEDGVAIFATEEHTKNLAEDPFYKLEHLQQDVQKAKADVPTVELLQELRAARSADDFAANQLLRKRFRTETHEIKAMEEEAKSKGLGIPLLHATEEDVVQGKLSAYQKPAPSAEQHRASQKQRLTVGSIFGSPTSSLLGPEGLRLEALKRKKLAIQPGLLRKNPS